MYVCQVSRAVNLDQLHNCENAGNFLSLVRCVFENRSWTEVWKPWCSLDIMLHTCLSFHTTLFFLINFTNITAHIWLVWTYMCALWTCFRRHTPQSRSGSAHVVAYLRHFCIRRKFSPTSTYSLRSVIQNCNAVLWFSVVTVTKPPCNCLPILSHITWPLKRLVINDLSFC